MKIHNSEAEPKLSSPKKLSATISANQGRSLLSEIEQNKKRTIWLMIGAGSIVGGFAFFISFAWLFTNDHSADNSIGSSLITMLVFVIGAALYLWFNYRHAAKHLMNMNKANELSPERLAGTKLGNIIDELVAASGIPKPRIFIIEDPTMNAFATGCDPEHGQIAFTTGLLNNMTPNEIKAVAGHEMGHIRNLDIRLNTVAMGITALIGGTGSVLLHWGWRMVLWGTDRRIDVKTLGIRAGLGGIMMFAGILILIIGLPLSKLTQAAVSRQRESLADVTSADITRDPQSMIDALRVLRGDNTPSKVLNHGVAAMFINDPGDGKRHWWNNLMTTHPPLDDRIERLEKLLK